MLDSTTVTASDDIGECFGDPVGDFLWNSYDDPAVRCQHPRRMLGELVVDGDVEAHDFRLAPCRSIAKCSGCATHALRALFGDLVGLWQRYVGMEVYVGHIEEDDWPTLRPTLDCYGQIPHRGWRLVIALEPFAGAATITSDAVLVDTLQLHWDAYCDERRHGFRHRAWCTTERLYDTDDDDPDVPPRDQAVGAEELQRLDRDEPTFRPLYVGGRATGEQVEHLAQTLFDVTVYEIDEHDGVTHWSLGLLTDEQLALLAKHLGMHATRGRPEPAPPQAESLFDDWDTVPPAWRP